MHCCTRLPSLREAMCLYEMQYVCNIFHDPWVGVRQLAWTNMIVFYFTCWPTCQGVVTSDNHASMDLDSVSCANKELYAKMRLKKRRAERLYAWRRKVVWLQSFLLKNCCRDRDFEVATMVEFSAVKLLPRQIPRQGFPVEKHCDDRHNENCWHDNIFCWKTPPRQDFTKKASTTIQTSSTYGAIPCH